MPYIDCETSFVPNTTMKIAVTSDGRQTQYCFYPDEGYVMHIKSNDIPIYDDDVLCENISGYTEMYGSAIKSVSINYDFSVIVPDTYTYTDENGTEVSVPIERIGAKELYALPKSIVPSEQIYDGVSLSSEKADGEVV